MLLFLIDSSNTYARCYSLVTSAYYYINASTHETITIRIGKNPPLY